MALHGGGNSDPCRILVYTDVALLNQSSFELETFTANRRQRLLPTTHGRRPSESLAAFAERLEKPESEPRPCVLSLLRARRTPRSAPADLTLRVAGVRRRLTWHQQLASAEIRSEAPDTFNHLIRLV